jgi:hypothetical protein
VSQIGQPENSRGNCGRPGFVATQYNRWIRLRKISVALIQQNADRIVLLIYNGEVCLRVVVKVFCSDGDWHFADIEICPRKHSRGNCARNRRSAEARGKQRQCDGEPRTDKKRRRLRVLNP